MDYINSTKNISIEFCLKLLSQYNFMLEDEQMEKIRAVAEKVKFGAGDDEI